VERGRFDYVRRSRFVVAVAVVVAATTALSCSLLVDMNGLAGGSADASSAEASGGGADAAGDVGAMVDATPRDSGAATDGGALDADAAVDADTRVTGGLLALYTFREDSGATVHDVSGVSPPLDLTIQQGDAGTGSFVANGFSFAGGFATSIVPATKIFSACQASGEITMETWATPSNNTDGPVRVAGLSLGYGNHDLGLDQSTNEWDALIRDSNGNAIDFTSPSGSLTTSMTQVVAARTKVGTWTLYLNGESVATMAPAADLTAWDTSFPMTMGNAKTFDAPFNGTVHLVAIYSRALTAAEVLHNYEVGVR
jgi:hypothetical protein